MVKCVTGQILTTFVGGNATLPCNFTKYPTWTGPVPNASITAYNNEGYSTFDHPRLGQKADRLTWGSNHADLVITGVLKEEDEGQYQCVGNRSRKIVQLDVRGILKTGKHFYVNCK